MSVPRIRNNNSVRKMVFHAGINDADYEVYQCQRLEGVMSVKWVCPYYRKWKNMLERCYSSKYQEHYPNYKNCTVCEEWLTFSNFKAWMEKKDWEGKSLDKDLKLIGNTVYSKDTCMFIDAKLNTSITKKFSKYNLPIGVSHTRKTDKVLYRTRMKLEGCKEVMLGTGNNPYTLHILWLNAKKDALDKLILESIDSDVEQPIKNWFNGLLEESEINYNLYLDDLKYDL